MPLFDEQTASALREGYRNTRYRRAVDVLTNIEQYQHALRLMCDVFEEVISIESRVTLGFAEKDKLRSSISEIDTEMADLLNSHADVRRVFNLLIESPLPRRVNAIENLKSNPHVLRYLDLREQRGALLSQLEALNAKEDKLDASEAAIEDRLDDAFERDGFENIGQLSADICVVIGRECRDLTIFLPPPRPVSNPGSITELDVDDLIAAEAATTVSHAASDGRDGSGQQAVVCRLGFGRGGGGPAFTSDV